MKGFQKSYLRGLGQRLRPAIRVGKNALDEAFLRELQQMLDQQELVKVKFAAHKEEKKLLARQMAEETKADLIGLIGHNALLYRESADPEKRHIRIPQRPDDEDSTNENRETEVL